MGSATIITNNEIKAIIKVIKSLENRGILVKWTATKITSQEGRFLNFLRPLMKSVFRPLAKSVLIAFGWKELQNYKRKSFLRLPQK